MHIYEFLLGTGVQFKFVETNKNVIKVSGTRTMIKKYEVSLSFYGGVSLTCCGICWMSLVKCTANFSIK